MITEKTIDAVILQIEEDAIRAGDIFLKEYQPLFLYFRDEIFTALDEEEQELMFFINLVIFFSWKSQMTTVPDFDPELYFSEEDQNWQMHEKAESWENFKDMAFRDYPQEDLLAFVEDMLAEDENSGMSPAARELIFITSKTLIDSLDASLTEQKEA